MGGKNSKNKCNKKEKDSKAKKSISTYGSDLNDEDYNFLTNQTGLTRAEIKSVFDKFNKNNPGNYHFRIESKLILLRQDN